jgi:hypothetical protein
MMASKCETCNEEKVMYYREWCPRCEKPEPKMNLLQAFYHIDRVIYDEHNQNIDPPGKDALWHKMCDYGYIKNDTSVSLDFSSWLEDLREEGEDDKDMLTYMDHLVKAFELDQRDSVSWEVSW